MNDDYLWDKTGEPDPQIQQLEEILGTLRYQPKPLALPAARRRSYFPMLAIAATVLLALLATGLWLRVRTSSQPAQREQAYVPAPSPIVEQEPDKPKFEKVAPPKKVRRNRSNQSAASAFAKREREEALAVKQQLMLALRLASEKLNLAHKKARIG